MPDSLSAVAAEREGGVEEKLGNKENEDISSYSRKITSFNVPTQMELFISELKVNIF